jgi:hypothetical protein
MSNRYVEHFRKQAKGLIPIQKFYVVEKPSEEKKVEPIPIQMVTSVAATDAIAKEEVQKIYRNKKRKACKGIF